jgi:uncharacterized protein HemY
MRKLVELILVGALFFVAGWWLRGTHELHPNDLTTQNHTTLIKIEKPIQETPNAQHEIQHSVKELTPNKFSNGKMEANRLTQDAMNSMSNDDAAKTADLFETALRLDPKNEFALSNYSNFLVMNHDCESAAPILKRCVEKFPQNQLCQGNSTTCVFDDPDALDQATQRCLKSDSKNMMCLNNRGQLFLRRNEYSAALAVFQQMEALNSHAQISFNTGVIAESLALAYEGVGNTVSAKEYFLLGCKEGMTLSCKKSSQN